MTSKKNRNHSCKSFCFVKSTFWQKCTCKLNVYIFYLHFALDIILGDRCDRKTPKTNYFIQVKPHLLVLEFSKNLLFGRNAGFDVILTSVIIIELDCLCKSFSNESHIGSEISKHQNILSLAHLIAFGVVTSSLPSTP